VTVRELPGLTALAIRETVAFTDGGAWCEAVYPELHAALDALGVAAAGPDSALWDDAFFTEGEGEAVAFVPVAVDLPRLAGGSGRTSGVVLPAINVASTVHTGPFDDLDQTYGALGTVVAERGIGLEGPIREIYLADDRCEVCWPVTRGAAT
jgi:effector-binding domain-containing protein